MSERPTDFIASFMDDYFAESEDHLTAVRRNLLMLESAIDRPDPPTAVVEALFRSFHSLKGISAMVELREAERLAHEMETCLGSMRRDQHYVLTAASFEGLVEGANLLEQVIAARQAGAAIPSIEHQLSRLSAACGATPGGTEHARAFTPAGSPAALAASAPGAVWTVTFTPSADLVARGIKVDTIRQRLADIGQIESVAPRVTADGGISFEFQLLSSNEAALRSWRDDGITYEGAAAPAPLGLYDQLLESATLRAAHEELGRTGRLVDGRVQHPGHRAHRHRDEPVHLGVLHADGISRSARDGRCHLAAHASRD